MDTLIGVAIGALLAGAVRFGLDEWRDRRAARAAARVVIAELNDAKLALELSAANGGAWARYLYLPTGGWDDHAIAFGGRMRAEQWEHLSHTFSAIKAFERSARETSSGNSVAGAEVPAAIVREIDARLMDLQRLALTRRERRRIRNPSA